MNVLIISPHFPPSNAADMQRVRLILPYLKEQGISAEVVAVQSEQVAAPQDDWLEAGLPAEVPIHRVQAVGLRWSKIPSLGTLAFRALLPVKKKMFQLLEEKRFDLVYFSTTQFAVQTIGAELKKRFGVPYVLDYQDPWVSDYYRTHPEVTPPGGKLKYGVSDFISRHLEPKALRDCTGVTSVSPAYPEQIEKRYQYGLPSLVVPFPGDDADFQRVKEEGVEQNIFNPHDGYRHWVYIGRGGQDMAFALRGLFTAIKDLKPTKTKFHFIGTSYAAAGQGVKTVYPLAEECGVADIVDESPDRIPYSQTLRCLLDAHGLVVCGSDDPGYTASKIYPYLLSEKPLLTLFHEKSSVCSLIKLVGGGVNTTFNEGDTPASIAHKLLTSGAFTADGAIASTPLKEEAFSPYTARKQAAQLRSFFTECLGE